MAISTLSVCLTAQYGINVKFPLNLHLTFSLPSWPSVSSVLPLPALELGYDTRMNLNKNLSSFGAVRVIVKSSQSLFT